MPQINQPEDVAAYNQSSLEDLAWAIEAGQGEFTLLFAYCNYVELRERLIKQLQAICEVNITEFKLDPSDMTLYSKIREQLEGKKPEALMISGLETVGNLDDLLRATNQVREEFRKNFPFPMVVWIDKEILRKFKDLATDFDNWGTKVWFARPIDILIGYLRQRTDSLFIHTLQSGSETFLPNEKILGENYRRELEAALEELQSLGQKLSPDLQAGCEFIYGRADYARDYFTSALEHYSRSLDFWRSRKDLLDLRDRSAPSESHPFERESESLPSQGYLVHTSPNRPQDTASSPPNPPTLGGTRFQSPPFQGESQSPPFQGGLGGSRSPLRAADLHFHIGLCYCRQAEKGTQKDWEKAKQSFQQCLDIFEQLEREDLVAKFINSLAEVLANLEEWEALQQLATKAINLHKTSNKVVEPSETERHETHYSPVLLAQDYGFLALVALKKSDYKEANKKADLALQETQKLPIFQQKYQSLYWLLLAQAQEHLGKHDEAVKSQEQAAVIEDKEQPYLYLRFLEELQSLYFNHKYYVDAYKAKQEQIAIKQQLGLIAFVGANRLIKNQKFGGAGRKKDVDKLLERIASTRNKITIIYGQSGVGKSSLVEAELIPTLKQKKRIQTRDLLTVYLRVYTDWVQELGEQLNQQLAEWQKNSDRELEEGLETKAIEVTEPYSLETVFQQLKHNDEQRNLLTVLIFDQFEEFFFVTKTLQEQQQFFQFFSKCLSLPFVKIILSLREDYLHLILQGTRSVNLSQINDDILDKNILYYVGNFSPQQATEVIGKLTASSPLSLDSDLIERLVETDLINELGEIRPIELQVVGAQLQAKDIRTLEAYEQLGEQPKEALIQGYLEAVIKDCGEENQTIAELVLSLLVDETNNTRPLKTRAELEQDLTSLNTDVSSISPKLELALEIFVLSGLVFRLPESPENRYQLVHDYLVDIILQQRGTHTLAELRQEKERRQLAEAKLKRFFQRALIASAGVIVILTTVTVYAVRFALQVGESEIITLSQSSKLLYSSNKQLLEPLIEALKAGKNLKGAFRAEADTRMEAITALKQSLFGVKERNRLVGHDSGVWGVAFSPDGQTIASASWDNTVKLWDLSGQQLLTLTGHDSGVRGVAFSPDGQTIASASWDKTVKLWDLSGQELLTLTGHDSVVNSVAFSPDGQTIASASKDNMVILWNFNLDDLLVRGCHWVGDYLRNNPNVRESDRSLCEGIF